MVAAKAGDGPATETIVLACQPLIGSIISKYVKSGLNLCYEDPIELFNEGTIVILERIQLYDPSKEASFKTYAYWWVEAKIKRLLSRCIDRNSKEILSKQIPFDE